MPRLRQCSPPHTYRSGNYSKAPPHPSCGGVKFMKKLTVLYDVHCQMCCNIRVWFATQPAFVELEFLAFQLNETRERFPGIENMSPERQLTIIADTGEVWSGVDAWIMCLWALRKYRNWSQRLALPALKPFARRVCELVSNNRYNISKWFFKTPPEQFADILKRNISIGN